MASIEFGKNEVVAWVKDHFPSGATCLDVGACDGKWFNLLGNYLKMDAVEIYFPYIEQYGLENKYHRMFCGDIVDFRYCWYDLIIFGDVIEHMTVEDAQKVLAFARNRCKEMIVSVPFRYKQGPERGNVWERHIQDDLTPELFKERYPGFKEIYVIPDKYAYYIKDKKDGD